MRYTSLQVTDAGVMLCAYHARRLAPEGKPALEAFARFADSAAPGCYTLQAGPDGIRIEPRPPSRLFDGIPVRMAVSPAAAEPGPFPKPAHPSAFDAIRVAGFSSLLTSADGTEILEACSAAVLGWDGARVVCVPADRPRVWSTAENAVREQLPVREVPLPAASSMPLLIVNAVKGTCRIHCPGREPFPGEVARRIEELYARLTSRRF